MGYLGGIKRAIDDPRRCRWNHYQSHRSKLLEDSYQEGKGWNKDMTVDANAIKLVLEQSTVIKPPTSTRGASSITR
jgi:hypothetical protein